jgi:NADPH-dependent 2,4-dienoyl-CoA reductase/sulfur reductase-like enzyme
VVREIGADVAVVGAGPAGLAAAAAAARGGASVVVLDAGADVGGQIWRTDLGVAAKPAARARGALLAAGVRLQCGATVFDAPSPRLLLVAAPDGVIRVRAERLILATGSRELWTPFPGATDPRVTGVGGLQALVKSGLDVRRKRVLVAGSGPLLWPVTARLRAAGARISAVLEQAPRATVFAWGVRIARRPAKWGALLGLLPVLAATPKRFAAWVVAVEPRADGLQVETADARGNRCVEVCDRLAVGYGLVADLTLATLLGAADGRAAALAVDDRQETRLSGVFAAGEITGVGGAEKAALEGEVAGLAAVGASIPRALAEARDRERAFAADLATTFALRPEIRAAATDDSPLCRCEAVTVGAAAAFPDARAAKLLTRCGMGACQGRVCGPALGYLRGFAEGSVRPPLVPTTVGELAEAWGFEESTTV